MSEFSHFLMTIPWFAWIPIVAIVGGIASGTITKFLELRHRHTERMAMIRMGMHPDVPGPSTAVASCEHTDATKPVGYQEL
jgi:hypothetical protein